MLKEEEFLAVDVFLSLAYKDSDDEEVASADYLFSLQLSAPAEFRIDHSNSVKNALEWVLAQLKQVLM